MMHTYHLDGFCYSEFRRPFAETELGRVVKELPLLTNAWIAGGAVRRMVMDEPLGADIDVFFKGEEDFSVFSCVMANTMRASAKAERTERREIWGFRCPHREDIKIDLVNARYFGGVEDIFSDFDLTCCQFAIDNVHLYVGEYAMLHAAKKICVPANATKLATWPHHLVRYMKQGFKASPEALDILVREMERDPRCLSRPANYSGGPA